MTNTPANRWLIKDREGRVRGPFPTDEVLRRITSGEFTVDEKIALYPGADWLPISKNSEFYDRLLATLEGERQSYGPDRSSAHEKGKESQGSQQKDEVKPESHRQGRAERVTQEKKEKKIGSAETTNRGAESGHKKEPGSSRKASPDEQAKSSDKRPLDEPIVLEPRRKIAKKLKAKKSVVPTIILLGAVTVVIYVFFFAQDKKFDQRIHLIAPRTGRPALAPEKVQALIVSGLQTFNTDTFSGYLRAQGDLVQAIEGEPARTEAMSLLCLTYLELWPYSFQDSSDVGAINVVSQLASRSNSSSIETATCRMVELLIAGRNEEARGLTDTILETYSGGGQPPTAFYFFKARALLDKKEYSSAVGYIRSTQQLWPTWLKLFVLEAEAYRKSGEPQKAAARYREVLKANSRHLVAQIELGLLEYFSLKNYQEGKSLLVSAVGAADRAPNEVWSRGLAGLAQIYVAEKNNSEALRLAKRAYELNATNQLARDLILQIGGAEALKNTRVVDTQLIFEGDQLVREGDYNGAQAFYKSAFEANSKNGMAAMKAAEALWEMSLSLEAIEWLNKAVLADPQLIDAYVRMAEYFTARFDFESAGKILNQAKQVAPQNYKVYRGFGYVELKRNNPEGAVSFAEKAIQLYPSDVESYVNLAKAKLMLRDHAQALSAASRAIEIDQNHQEAQITYASALFSARGAQLAIDHIRKLVSTYPTVTAYRLALGELYARDQSYANAESVFQQVIRIEDRPKRAYLELGKVFAAQQKYEDAVRAFFKAAEIDPADVEPLFRSGLLYLDARKPSDARRQFQRVQAVNKDYPLVNFYMGRAAFMMEAYDEALEQAQAEKNRNPNLADPYILAAEVYAARQQYSLCAGEYQQVVKLRRQGSDTYVKMARCYRMSGNIDAAAAMIAEANTQESGNPEVWKEQGAIFEMKGEAVRAISAYNQYLVLRPNAPDRGDVEARIMALSR